VKRTGRDKSIGAVIHVCMETTQGSSLCRYLYLKLEKHHILLGREGKRDRGGRMEGEREGGREEEKEGGN
jgi:hypothetical protein